MSVAAVILGGAYGARARRRRAARRYSFRGRTVLISGGARGLGLALARLFAREGAHVVVFARSGDDLMRARLELEAAGARVTAFVCDVRDPRAVDALVGRVVELTGRIDVLVNNAGIIQSVPFEHARIDDFEDSLATHFWAPLYLIRACLPHMRGRQTRIVNISSFGGRVAVPHLIPYCAGKFAVTALSDGLQAELAGTGVAVTTVTPGLMRTGSHRNVLVRGDHRNEARWFGLGTATSLTSMNADRAARQIVEAARAGRPRLTPGWQGRLGIAMNGVAPGLVALVSAAVVRFVLPPASARADAGELKASRDLDLGRAAAFMPSRAARRFNQPVAVGETVR
jgi:NAD(P)-dependent dehydrogenase (short-subunit alcohol dehydrogenase family)